MKKLKIEYINKEDLKPYCNNAKLHPAEQVEQIKHSIREFGFNDPIAVWGDNEVVEGHGRLLAVMDMDDIETVPVIRLDGLSDEQRRAYMLVHNSLTMNTGFDLDLLESELKSILDIDMSQFGIEIQDVQSVLDNANPYTPVVNLPQYDVKGENYSISQLYNADRYRNVLAKIESATMDKETKEFLKLAAGRLVELNFKRIAEYYAAASEEIQELMEDQALVIIDVKDAIAKGYALMKDSIEEAIFGEE